MSERATFRFESPTAAEKAAAQLRAAGYATEPDPNSGALGFAVAAIEDLRLSTTPARRSRARGFRLGVCDPESYTYFK